MKRLTVLSIAATGMLAGCVSWTDPAALASRDLTELCLAYQRYHGQDTDRATAIRAEINRRNAVNPADWDSIEKRNIVSGMSLCAAYAAFGPPLETDLSVKAGAKSARLTYPWGIVHADGNVIKDVVTQYR